MGLLPMALIACMNPEPTVAVSDVSICRTGNPAPGPLNSRYFRPVRRKETRARRWDLQFESTSLQRRVRRTSNSFSPAFPGALLDDLQFEHGT